MSQSCNDWPAFCDDVLGWGSGSGALVFTGSWSLAAGSFTVAVAPAGGSMGRGTHGVTAAQPQPGHQQWTRTRVPEPAVQRTMEAVSGAQSGGRSSWKPPESSTDARGVPGTGANRNPLHSRRKPAGRGPACAGRGVECLDDARGRSLHLAPPCCVTDGEEPGRWPHPAYCYSPAGPTPMGCTCTKVKAMEGAALGPWGPA